MALPSSTSWASTTCHREKHGRTGVKLSFKKLRGSTSELRFLSFIVRAAIISVGLTQTVTLQNSTSTSALYLNTSGCLNGFYTTDNGPCRPCDCHQNGTKSCDELNGKCICHNNVMGGKCDTCAENFYGLGGPRNTCRPCLCDIHGSRNGSTCDRITGQCSCKTGYRHRACDECDVSYYRDKSLACIPCACHSEMSLVPTIDARNAREINNQCGLNFSLGDYCYLNALNLTRHCDIVNGQCSCPPESTGRQCERCAPRYALLPGSSTCVQCETCSSTLMDFLEEVNQDLQYAERTIEKGRLAATVGFRISELETAIFDHSHGLNSSASLLSASSSLIGGYLGMTANFTSDNVTTLIDRLEADLNFLESEISSLKEEPRDFGTLSETITATNKLVQAFDTQFKTLSSSCLELSSILDSYQPLKYSDSSTHLKNDLIEYDNFDMIMLVESAEEITKTQAEVFGKDIDTILTDLTADLVLLENLRLEARNTDISSGEQLLASQLFNISLPFDECGLFSSNVKLIHDSLEESKVDIKEIQGHIIMADQSIKTSAAKLDNEQEVVRNLSSLLKKLDLRLGHARERFSRSCSNTFAILMRNMDNLTSIDSSVALLRNLTDDLGARTNNMSTWLDTEIAPKQAELASHNQHIFRDYRDVTTKWNEYFDILRFPNEAWDRLISVNHSFDDIERNIDAYASETNETTMLNESTRSHTASIDVLLSSINDLGAGVTNLELGIEREVADLRRINGIVELLMNSNASQLPSEIDELDEQIENHLSLGADVKAYMSSISEIIGKFSARQHSLVQTYRRTSIKSDILHIIESDILDYLTTPKPFEGNKSMVAHDYLNQLKASMDQLNYNDISENTEIADIKMRQSLTDIQSKVDQTRLMLNHIQIGRKFRPGSPKSSYETSFIRLKNPTDLTESSTYTSISFFIKPDNCSDGTILLIGTSKPSPPLGPPVFGITETMAHNLNESNSGLKPGNLAEYMAIELRQSRIAVVMNLGSQTEEEVEDDVKLLDGSWQKVSVVRIGTLLTITITTEHSKSSVTRPLHSQHVVLDLDHSRTSIFVGGLPIGKSFNESAETSHIPLGLKSLSGFSGWVDDLRLNEHRLGLWNTVASDNELASASEMFLAGYTNTSNPESGTRNLAEHTRLSCSDSSEYQHLFDGIAKPTGETFQFSSGYALAETQGCMDYEFSRNDTSPKNLLSLRFRTGVPNALLLLAQISNQTSDFLVLQLNQGQLELVMVENGTIHSSISQQKPQSSLNSLADHSWHQVECPIKFNPSSPSQTSIQLRVDAIQRGQVNVSGNISGLCASNTLLGGGLDQLETSMGVKLYSRLQDMQLAHLISATQFTGCVQALRLGWSGGAIDITTLKRSKNVRERACQEPVRMVSFPRPKSNISSSFVQILNVNDELDSLLFEKTLPLYYPPFDCALDLDAGHIHRLTIRFKTQQPNGLLVHHSRPDHSLFFSIYISGGRLMMAFNSDRKIRFESYMVLSDGQWHMLHIRIGRHLINSQLSNMTGSHPREGYLSDCGIKHKVIAILDDKFVYKDRFNITTPGFTGGSSSNSGLKHSASITSGGDAFRSPRLARSLEHESDKPDTVNSSSSNDIIPESMPLISTEPVERLKKVLYFGGVEDKFIPLLRNQQIPTNFHGCIADVTINNIRLDFVQTNKNQGVLMNQCQLIG